MHISLYIIGVYIYIKSYIYDVLYIQGYKVLFNMLIYSGFSGLKGAATACGTRSEHRFSRTGTLCPGARTQHIVKLDSRLQRLVNS